MSRRTPGMPIPGTERTVTAAEQAAALGLQPGSAPKEAQPQKPTPAQARKLMSDEWPGEPPDIGLEVITIPGGRDVMDALGVDPASLPVGVEAELGKPQPRPERRPREGGAEASPTPAPAAPLDASAADELRTAYRTHVAHVTAIAESAKQSGDAEREAKAAAEVRATAELGQRLKAKLGGVL